MPQPQRKVNSLARPAPGVATRIPPGLQAKMAAVSVILTQLTPRQLTEYLHIYNTDGIALTCKHERS